MVTLKILLLALALAACAPPEPAAPTGDRAGTVGVDTVRADLTGVPDSLRSCVPQAYAGRPVRVEYVGQMSPDGQPTKVLLESFDDADPASALDFTPVILNVRASGCSTEEPSGTPRDTMYEEAALLLTNPTILQRHAELRVAAAGGPEAYADLYRTRFDRDLQECQPGDRDSEAGCVASLEAAAYRALGVSVAPPAEDRATVAALSPVLRSCLPPSVLRSAVSIAEVARTRDGGSDYVLLDWSETPANSVDLNTLLLRVRGESCESLLPAGTDLAVPDVVSDPIADALADGRIDTQIQRAGGIDAYAEQLRAQNGGRLTECSGPVETWRSCLAPSFADRLRARGISVSDA